MPDLPEPFDRWMDRALYDAQRGYYRRPRTRVGPSGDFVTAVSAGPWFGKLLAFRLHALWCEAGEPGQFAWVEQGAEDGCLSADVLAALQQHWPTLAEQLQPVLIEPWPPNREAQAATLPPDWRERIRWVDSVDQLEPFSGLFFANELLDAFPARVFERGGEGWCELGVVEAGDGRQWQALGGVPSDLPPGLTEDLPAPWTWEHQPGLQPWLANLVTRFEGGAILLLDYGFTDSELRDPVRRHGTLRSYHRHRQCGALDHPAGEADLTVHVHWDELRRAAGELGLHEHAFREQGRHLTHLAAPLLREIEANGTPPDPVFTRQLQRLLHPAHFGAKFQALEWTR